MADDTSARAFAPGHVTAFFSPCEGSDSQRIGSTGAGLTLTDGVTATVEPADRTTIHLNSERARLQAVEYVLNDLSVTARVALETPLPVGAGFGVSGAAALSTAFATNLLFDLNRTENELITTAHSADVRAGTGLGDVVAAARGGIPIRIRPGAPEYGELDGIPANAEIEYTTFGSLSTSTVLESDSQRLSAAGERALRQVRRRPTVETLFAAGRRFARTTGLLSTPVADLIAAVEEAGGQAMMAMLGHTVVALGEGLSRVDHEARKCHIGEGGVTLRTE